MSADKTSPRRYKTCSYRNTAPQNNTQRWPVASRDSSAQLSSAQLSSAQHMRVKWIDTTVNTEVQTTHMLTLTPGTVKGFLLWSQLHPAGWSFAGGRTLTPLERGPRSNVRLSRTRSDFPLRHRRHARPSLYGKNDHIWELLKRLETGSCYKTASLSGHWQKQQLTVDTFENNKKNHYQWCNVTK